MNEYETAFINELDRKINNFKSLRGYKAKNIYLGRDEYKCIINIAYENGWDYRKISEENVNFVLEYEQMKIFRINEDHHLEIS